MMHFMVLQLLVLGASLGAAGHDQCSLSGDDCDGGLLVEDAAVSLLQTQLGVQLDRASMNATPSMNATAAAVAPPEKGAPAVKPSLVATGGTPIRQNKALRLSEIVAEFIAMALFVVVGCGSAMGIAKEEGSAWVFQVSLTFGLAITVLAYAVAHYSGGQINCAVTFALVLTGQCTIAQGILNFIGQMLGSITGAFILLAIYPTSKDKTGGLGSNSVNEGWSTFNALMGEFLMTFFLAFVVLETATNPLSQANDSQAPLAIGCAVFCAHCVLIPIDGCSINPTRSFGPAVVAQTVMQQTKPLADMWIFWVGPLLGAAAAAGVSAGLMT